MATNLALDDKLIIKAQKAKCCVVFYEDLITNGEAQWVLMAQSLGFNAVPSKEVRATPSQQASTEMKKGLSDDNQLTKWKGYFTKKQLIEIDNILNIFHVTIYSAFHPVPISRVQTDEHL